MNDIKISQLYIRYIMYNMVCSSILITMKNINLVIGYGGHIVFVRFLTLNLKFNLGNRQIYIQHTVEQEMFASILFCEFRTQIKFN